MRTITRSQRWVSLSSHKTRNDVIVLSLHKWGRSLKGLPFFVVSKSRKNRSAVSSRIDNKQREQISLLLDLLSFSGERGIRTPGSSHYGGFQDRCNRPLCHLSNLSLSVALFLKRIAKVRPFFISAIVCRRFFQKNV